jgi:hypothetical protein
VVLVVTDPLWGAGRAHPLRGRVVTRWGSLGRAGGCWVGGRIFMALSLVPGQGGFLVTDCLCKGGGELEIVERFLGDDEGLEAVARFLGGELEPERRVASLEVPYRIRMVWA